MSVPNNRTLEILRKAEEGGCEFLPARLLTPRLD